MFEVGLWYMPGSDRPPGVRVVAHGHRVLSLPSQALSRALAINVCLRVCIELDTFGLFCAS